MLVLLFQSHVVDVDTEYIIQIFISNLIVFEYIYFYLNKAKIYRKYLLFLSTILSEKTKFCQNIFESWAEKIISISVIWQKEFETEDRALVQILITGSRQWGSSVLWHYDTLQSTLLST